MDSLQRNMRSSEGKEQPSLLRHRFIVLDYSDIEAYVPHIRPAADRVPVPRSLGDESKVSRSERMKRFQHHTEQQMQRMSQEPKQTEYENCFIQPVNASESSRTESSESFHSPALYQTSNSTLSQDSILNTFPRVNHFGRVRSQAFSVDSHPTAPLKNSSFSQRKAFAKEKLSLQKTHRLKLDVDSDDSANKPRADKKKKRIIFTSLFGKKKHHSKEAISESEETSSDSKSTSSSKESPHQPPALSMPIQAPKPVNPVRNIVNATKEFHTEDLDLLRKKVMAQNQEITQLKEMAKTLQSEMAKARQQHKENYKELLRRVSANHTSMKSMEKELLERKRQQETQLTESLLGHYRSTLEDQVKDVQKRVSACNNRRKNVVETNNTPFRDFASRLLAYAVAGFTVVCSVFVCMNMVK